MQLGVEMLELLLEVGLGLLESLDYLVVLVELGGSCGLDGGEGGLEGLVLCCRFLELLLEGLGFLLQAVYEILGSGNA